MPSGPLLTLHNLAKTFKGAPRPAVDDLSLTVDRGELFGLLGPSGCGKTTTLRLILGLEAADRGRVMFNARDITSAPAEQRGFGIVFQNYALFTELNVFENVAFGLRSRGQPTHTIRHRVDHLLALVELPREIGQRRTHQLSAGEQQRVAIARALATGPELLLLDEPFANLDASLRRRTGDEIRQLVKSLNIAAIFVTHDQNEAFNLCDRMAVMRDGNAIQTGTPCGIYERPSQPWVAAFLGFQLLAAKRVPGSTTEFIVSAEGSQAEAWRLEANSASPVQDRAIIAIRPEDVQLGPPNANLNASVHSVIFGGPTSRVILRVGTQTLDALVLRGQEPQPGSSCGIHIPRHRPLVYSA